MPKLIILYDPDDKLSGLPPETLRKLNIKEATLALREDHEVDDVRAAADGLLKLLIEQLQ